MHFKERMLSEPVWALDAEEVVKLVESSREGITEEEAAARLAAFGRNTLPERSGATRLKIVVRQFTSPLILILVGAGVVTFAIGDYKDSGFIFAAVLVNAALGFYQENKAETALQSLKSYVKERVRVIRSGREREVDAEEIVPGDVIHLVSGARVPADARVLYANELSVNEAVLTGESLPEAKSPKAVGADATVADQDSMVFSGTLVAGGTGLAVVVRTGADTELGKIAALVGRGEEKTPLQVAIGRFSARVGALLLILVGLLFALGTLSGYGLFEMFLISVAVAVSAVPEGLPIALTVILAVGVERLARRKGVVRKLLAAEALGSTTIVLTDKTGTLTEAKMELSDIITEGDPSEVLEAAMLAADVVVENPDDDPQLWRMVGSPLEVALVAAGVSYQLFLPRLKSEHKVLSRRPFNSTDKFSSAEVKMRGRRHTLYLGAPDVLAERLKLSGSEEQTILLNTDELAYSGYRVVGVARDDKFLGILAFHDPVRKGVGEAIKAIERAGVKTVIVTGDHKGTALSVAGELGIIVKEDEVLTGEEMRKMGDAELTHHLPYMRVFARVTPEDKLRLVRLYQEMGETVAVTGDGVNDAPALEGASIGVAVGSGTDVAKGAADLVILDDNFETIVAAIGEGRQILQNIRKVIVYLFSSVLDELILIGGALVTGLPLPLNALQILWVNFFSDSFPAVSLAFEKERDVFSSRPSDLKRRLIDKEMRFLIFVIGASTSALLFILYYLLLRLGYQEEIVRTFVFGSFAMYTLFLIFAVKSLRRSILRYNPFGNPYLVAGAGIGILLTLAAIYAPPLQNLLDTAALPPLWFLAVVAVGVVNIGAVEFGKYLYRRK